MTRRDRNRRPARKLVPKNQKPVILIVSEGKVTEPEYLKGFAKSIQNGRVDIETAGGAGVPMTVVEAAISKRDGNKKHAKQYNDDNILYDAVWCVFDVDDHPNVDEAKRKALTAGLKVVVSNPSFELWLLVHFIDSPGMQHRDVIRNRLKKFVPDYDKSVNFKRDFEGKVYHAEKIAQRMQALVVETESEGNPSTDMYKLTRAIAQD